MPLAVEVNWVAVLTGIAAIISAMGGCIMAYSAVVKARGETRATADSECEERLLKARHEAVEFADEVYRMKSERARDIRPEEGGGT